MDILLIRFSSLGDVVLMSAVVEALARRSPGCSINILTKRRYSDVFASDERITQVTGIEDNDPVSGIIDQLGRSQFDAVIDLHRSIRSVRVAAKLRAPVKRGIRKNVIGRRMMVWTRNRYRRHFDVLESYLSTLGGLGTGERVMPRIFPSPEAVVEAERLLSGYRSGSGTGRIIGIAPGARHDTKRWNEQSFASLAGVFADRGDKPVFIGDSGDREVIGRIATTMKRDVASFAGDLTLAGTIGLISQLDAVVTNDSGPMHLAGALGVPFAAVFGPTHPDLGFCPGYPRGCVITTNEPCSPCSLHGDAPCRMTVRRCMDAVTVEMVRDCIDGMLE
jgi:heptosyltransferase II